MITHQAAPRIHRERVDVQDYFELRSWAKRFGVTAGEVRRAVARVGNVPKDVESYLESERLGAGASLRGNASW